MDDLTRIQRDERRRLRGKRAWWVAAALLAALVGSIGCAPISTLSALVAPFSNNNIDPVFDLTIPDKESKVVFIVAHSNPNNVSEIFRDADQVLCTRLTNMLALRYKENKEKVTIVPVSKVYAYMHDHPGWITQSKQEIGKKFGADFVAYLELGHLSMYENKSTDLYRGNVDITIKVADVNVGDTSTSTTFKEAKVRDSIFTCTYPTNQPEDRFSMSPPQFRAAFLERVAKGLVPYFVASPPKSRTDID
ncbi:MAG TPA: hypothetical protein VE988_24180 [Gemmataceae bacterium]|nr:hypothetical protein [Gemmataceae bacterium]